MKRMPSNSTRNNTTVCGSRRELLYSWTNYLVVGKMWRLFTHSFDACSLRVGYWNVIWCCMCVSSCAFRVSYHCFVCAWLRNMYLPNRNARNKNNLGTQETPWWNSAGLTGRNVRSQPWHRVDGPPWITPWIWWFSGRFPMWETTTGRHWIAGAHQLTRMWTNKCRRLDDFGKVFLIFVYVFLGVDP